MTRDVHCWLLKVHVKRESGFGYDLTDFTHVPARLSESLLKTFSCRLLYFLTAIFAAVCTNKVAKLKAQVSLPSDALAAVIVMDNRPTPYSAWILEGMQRTTSLIIG